jgi:mono/diheme cytochrome c family protein
MPELAFNAPSLAGVGQRLDPKWLAAWILEPKKLSADATMPQLLTHADPNINAQNAADLAVYLNSLKQPSAALSTPAASPTLGEKRIQQGLEVFENLGCIACHHLNAPDREDDYNRRSLHFAHAKFLPGQLTAFLQQPHQHDASSRMPDFQLSADEAEALAAFIQSRVQGEVTNEARKGDATRGVKLFQTVGCANCHTTNARPATTTNIKTLTAGDLHGGCLAQTPERRDSAPDFHFSATQREGLLTFLATDRRSLARETPSEFSLRQVRALNCIACHRRDGASNVHSLVLSEEGEQGFAPEVLPLLTWAGEKLKPEWTEKLLADQLKHRSRHWLRARMPVFPAHAKHLAIGLSHEHGFAPHEDVRPAPAPELGEIGAKLVESEGGFGCIKCHAVGDRKPLAPFEAPGINLVDAAERLRYSYYPRWMLDPPRVDVLTKMPKFSVDGRTTGVPALDGDAARQNLALWHYLQTLAK